MNRMFAVLALLLFSAPVWAEVTVTGTGTVQATPDMSVIRLAVVTSADTVVPALDDNGKAVRKLKTALTAMNIDEKDVCTTSFNIQPQYTNPKDNEQPKLIGYVVQHDITVRVRKLSDAGKVVDAVVKDGANRVYSVGFTFSDPEALLDKARVAAVEDARRKADQMVKAAGGKVGYLKSVTEQRAYSSYADSGMRAMGGPSGQPVGPGERTLTVNVTVAWDIDNPPGRRPGDK